ncbi:hypothetical protein LV779_07245 [Streptomyces thinghirensis]|nr:hypothetical protein [Streptomyces thinghirensis]
MTTGTEEARIPLDPFVTDLDGGSARLRAAGPLAGGAAGRRARLGRSPTTRRPGPS